MTFVEAGIALTVVKLQVNNFVVAGGVTTGAGVLGEVGLWNKLVEAKRMYV